MNMQTNNFGNFGRDYINGNQYNGGLKPPDPDDPNGCDCPQCQEWTWRHTQHCIFCGYDILAHNERLRLKAIEEQRAFRQQQSRYLAMFNGIISFCALIVFEKFNISALNLCWVLLVSTAFFFAVQKYVYK